MADKTMTCFELVQKFANCGGELLGVASTDGATFVQKGLNKFGKMTWAVIEPNGNESPRFSLPVGQNPSDFPYLCAYKYEIDGKTVNGFRCSYNY